MKSWINDIKYYFQIFHSCSKSIMECHIQVRNKSNLELVVCKFNLVKWYLYGKKLFSAVSISVCSHTGKNVGILFMIYYRQHKFTYSIFKQERIVSYFMLNRSKTTMELAFFSFHILNEMSHHYLLSMFRSIFYMFYSMFCIEMNKTIFYEL